MAERETTVRDIRSIDDWIGQWPESPVVLLAVRLADIAGSLPDDLNKTFQPWPGVPSPAPSRWIAFYRQHRRIRSIAECFGMGPHSIIGPLEPLSVEQEAVLRGVDDEGDRAAVIEKAKARAQIHPHGSGVFAAGASAMISDEGQFFGRVVLPYLIVYGEWPTKDYHNVRHRDLVALDRLLRVDKGVIEDKAIRRWHAETGLARNTRLGSMIAAALQSKPIKLSRKQAKVFMASMISWVFAEANLQINVSQICKLFDLLASAGSSRTDHDLPASSKTLAKAIQRGRKQWEAHRSATKKIG